MIDKVQKIKEWIKEKIACWCNESQCEVPELPKQIIEGKILALREMLSFIDSLQEEKKVPKFCVGDIVRHKNYGEQKCGDCRITYVSENSYSYMYVDGTGGGAFGFSNEEDYNLIKED